jgi:hypothetical protein
MANEIRELTRNPIRGGRLSFHVIRLFQVDPVIEVNGVAVILRPRTDLPEGVERLHVLNVVELGKIDAGTLTWDTDHVAQKDSNEPLLQVLGRVQVRYAARAARLVPLARIQYANFGKKHDA